MKKLWWFVKGFIFCFVFCFAWIGVESRLSIQGDDFDRLVAGKYRFKGARIAERKEDCDPDKIRDKGPTFIGFC